MIPPNPELGTVVPEPPSEPNHYFGVAELFTETLYLFGTKFVRVFLALLIPNIVVMMLAVGVGFVTMGAFSMALKNSPYTTAVVPLYILIFVFGTVLQLWGGMAVVVNLLADQKMGVVESYKRSWQYVGRYWWLCVLEMLILSAGFVLLIIPGIVLAILFLFSQFVLVEEEYRGLNALMISREYIKGYAWSVFGRLLLLGALLASLVAIFEVIVLVLKIDKNPVVSTIGSISMVGISIFVLSLLVTMYKNIKDLKGGGVSIDGKPKWGYVVMAVLGLLCFLGIPAIGLFVAIDPAKQIEKANLQRSFINKTVILNGVKLFYAENTMYPKKLDELTPKYIKQLPENPDKELCYLVSINKITTEIKVTDTKKIGADCNTEVLVN
jgi:hypothetical protein